MAYLFQEDIEVDECECGYTPDLEEEDWEICPTVGCKRVYSDVVFAWLSISQVMFAEERGLEI